MVFVKKHINLGSRIAGVYREDIYELPLDKYAHVTETMRRDSANRMQAFYEAL